MSILSDPEALASVPTPSSSQQALYLDSSTNAWSTKNSSGVGTPLVGLVASMLPGFLGGLGLSNDGTSPNTVIDIAKGACASDDSTTIMSLVSAITKTTGAWVSGSGNGGLDTGSIGAASWYHVFVIENPTSGAVDALISLNATSPTMPSGYTKKRRIGSIKTNGSSQIIAFTQQGDYFNFQVPILEYDAASGTTSAVTQTLVGVPLGVNVRAILTGFAQDSSTWVVYFSDLGSTDEAPSATFLTWTGSASNQVGGRVDVRTNTSAQIRMRNLNSATTVSLTSVGWIDLRGQG